MIKVAILFCCIAILSAVVSAAGGIAIAMGVVWK
jgi:hypothetical protein